MQLNKYETDPYFLQIFQSNLSVCLIISVFCKSCEPICEPEITPLLYHLENLQKSKPFHVQCSVQKSYRIWKWTSSCIGNFEENMDLSRIYLAVLGMYNLASLLKNPVYSKNGQSVIADLWLLHVQTHGLRTPNEVFFQHIPNVLTDWPNKLWDIWGTHFVTVHPWFLILHKFIIFSTKTTLSRHFLGTSIWVWFMILAV